MSFSVTWAMEQLLLISKCLPLTCALIFLFQTHSVLFFVCFFFSAAWKYIWYNRFYRCTSHTLTLQRCELHFNARYWEVRWNTDAMEQDSISITSCTCCRAKPQFPVSIQLQNIASLLLQVTPKTQNPPTLHANSHRHHWDIQWGLKPKSGIQNEIEINFSYCHAGDIICFWEAKLLNEMEMANTSLFTLRCLGSTVFPANKN